MTKKKKSNAGTLNGETREQLSARLRKTSHESENLTILAFLKNNMIGKFDVDEVFIALRRLIKRRKVTENNCWVSGKGYGWIEFAGGRYIRSRWIAAIFHGLDLNDRDQWGCHHCDNPPCFNPSHIYCGNATTNALDALKRGRRILPYLYNRTNV